jgi:hypothetical protein
MTTFSNNSSPYADSPFASVGQSILNRAANFPVAGKECGALPRRRYARKVLKLSPCKIQRDRQIIMSPRTPTNRRPLRRLRGASRGRAGHSGSFRCVASHNVVIGAVGLRVPSPGVPPTGHRCARLHRGWAPVAAATVLGRARHGMFRGLSRRAWAGAPGSHPRLRRAHYRTHQTLCESPLRSAARAPVTPVTPPALPTAPLEKSGAGAGAANVAASSLASVPRSSVLSRSFCF